MKNFYLLGKSVAVYWVQRNKGPSPPTHPHSQKVNGKGRGVIVENKVDGRGVLNTSHQNRCKSAIGQMLKSPKITLLSNYFTQNKCQDGGVCCKSAWEKSQQLKDLLESHWTQLKGAVEHCLGWTLKAFLKDWSKVLKIFSWVERWRLNIEIVNVQSSSGEGVGDIAIFEAKLWREYRRILSPFWSSPETLAWKISCNIAISFTCYISRI